MKIPKFKLVTKTILLIVILLIMFTVAMCVIGFWGFRDALLNQYADAAFRIADIAALSLNPDRMDAIVESGEDTDEYRIAWERLDELCNTADVEFIYVIRPDRSDYGHITFLFSTVNHKSQYEPYPLGYVRETTNDEYRVKYRALYDREADEELLVLHDRSFNVMLHHITAMIPLVGTDGQTQAILCVQRQLNILNAVQRRYLQSTLAVLVIMTLITIIWEGSYMRIRILQPINQITKEASRFAEENVTTGTKLTDTIKSGDEIGLLASSIDQMEEQIVNYIEDTTRYTAEKERMKAELNLGARIQSAMLPSVFPPFPDRTEFEIYASMDPAREVGGDFYDFFLIDDDHLCLVIADVSGKGIPAALFMMATRSIIKNAAHQRLTPAEIMENANNAICTSNTEEMFITAWLGVLEISTGKLVATNAGHEYPMLRYPGEQFWLLKDKHSFILGGMENVTYKNYELFLKPGTTLFIYTDGLPEATDADNRMFGTERTLEVLNRDPDADPEQLLRNIDEAVACFVKDAEQFDDLTMLGFLYKGPQKRSEQTETEKEG